MWNLKNKQRDKPENRLFNTETNWWLPEGSSGEMGKICEGAEEVQTCSYK